MAAKEQVLIQKENGQMAMVAVGNAIQRLAMEPGVWKCYAIEGDQMFELELGDNKLTAEMRMHNLVTVAAGTIIGTGEVRHALPVEDTSE